MDKIEIPFGAYDSETLGWTYTIPKGYTAKIEDGKIIVKKEETKDERIRKSLIYYLHGLGEFDYPDKETYNNWLAYLEKQKEQRELPLMNGDAELYFDDWNQQKQNRTKRQCFEEGIRYAQRLQKEQKPAEWNEYDKACINNIVLLLDGNGKYVPDGAKQQCLEWFNQHRIAFQNRYVEWSKEDEKIRKEIRDLLVNACEADRRYPKLLAWLESPRQVQNPEWSEEDEKILNELLDHCNTENATWYNWLKSLHPQPKQEWSEEDEKMRKYIISDLREFRDCETDEEKVSDYEDEISWLKALRPQPGLSKEDFIKFGNLEYERGFKDGERSHWKPSEEQMKAFKGYIEEFQAKAEAAVGGWNNFDVMIRLYEQLKKLI